MVCTIKDKTVDVIHKNHTICKQCLQKYIRYMEVVEGILDARTKCPVPNCKFRFVYTSEFKDHAIFYSLYCPFIFKTKAPPPVFFLF